MSSPDGGRFLALDETDNGRHDGRNEQPNQRAPILHFYGAHHLLQRSGREHEARQGDDAKQRLAQCYNISRASKNRFQVDFLLFLDEVPHREQHGADDKRHQGEETASLDGCLYLSRKDGDRVGEGYADDGENGEDCGGYRIDEPRRTGTEYLLLICHSMVVFYVLKNPPHTIAALGV